jgi:hypothetical protein
MQLLDDYAKLRKQLLEYFGYEESWIVLPIEDQTDVYWSVSGDYVTYADSLSDYNNDEDNMKIYEDVILSGVTEKGAIFRGTEFTMIAADTQTDGNKFLMIFDNAKEQPPLP